MLMEKHDSIGYLHLCALVNIFYSITSGANRHWTGEGSAVFSYYQIPSFLHKIDNFHFWCHLCCDGAPFEANYM